MGDVSKLKELIKQLLQILHGEGPGAIGSWKTCKEFVEEHVDEDENVLCVNAQLTSGAWEICKKDSAIQFFQGFEGGLNVVVTDEVIKQLIHVALAII